MNVAVEKLPNCLATLRIELEPDRVAQKYDALTSEYAKAVKLPGYRPGKAPRAVVERKFKKEIREELEKQLLNDATREAIKQENLRVMAVANIDDVELGDDKSMKFTATLVTQPEFDLPQYKGLVVPMHGTEVTDAEIEESLENLRDQAADFVDVPERGAAMGDFVVVDYKGMIDGKPVHEVFPKAGKPLSGNEDFWIKMTEEAFFPGYCAALVDAKPGETRSFEVEVPADFPVEGMPGQKIAYEVTLKAIKDKVLPPLDDAFAETISKGKTLEEVRQMAREELGRQKVSQAETTKRNEIMRQLLTSVECELPQDLVRQQTRSILNDIVKENQTRGVADEVLKENEKELVGAAATNARDRVKGTFILLRIAEQEGIKVKREELMGRIATLAERYEMSFEKMLKELQKRNALDQINEEILTGKVLDFLSSNASVTTAPAGQ
ncbi:MAG TPA: trigger factor [Chthoniobacteraceae bacterium]|jgi:trigger factor|nr:trigger factor [Chthoniobacteraceae bacterium]